MKEKYKYGNSRLNIAACGCRGCQKHRLNTFDHLADLPKECHDEEYVEVLFKNTHKGYYLNSLRLPLSQGDLVVVEASPGYDIGTISLMGPLVRKQMIKHHHSLNDHPRRIYRLARPNDIEKYQIACELEQPTMIRSREIAADLGLDMKIGNVEYQGDGTKAIFYYIASHRVDFRELIRKFGEEFHIRVEMKQIGARQEAGLIGGLGPCGRELCCSGHLTTFDSVSTDAVSQQNLPRDAEKQTGLCAKLKCCLNYEVDLYYESNLRMPPKNLLLHTESGTFRQIKRDSLADRLYYVNKSHHASSEIFELTTERVYEIAEMNKREERPFSLTHDEEVISRIDSSTTDILGESSLTRFDGTVADKSANKRRNSNKKKKLKSAPSTPNRAEVAPEREGTPSHPSKQRPRGKRHHHNNHNEE